MVLRLVLDAARRKRLIGAFAVFQLYILYKIPLKIWPDSDGMPWTMAGAWFLTIGTSELFNTRELYQLPVSRRTWWLARWWLSMTAPAAMAQLAAVFAYWSTQSEWPTVEYVLLSLALTVLYCGCALAYHATTFGRSGDEPATFASAVTSMPIFIGFIAAPFLLAPYLPHAFAEIGITSAIVMLAMVAFALHGYRHTPEVDARPDMRIARRIPSAHGPAPVVMTPAGFAGRLTGLSVVLWDESRKQLITFSSLIALGVASWAVVSRFRPVLPLDEVLRLAGVMPFTSSRAMITEPIVFGAIVVIVATMMEPGMVANIRSLRTLPISSVRLACIPAGLGLVSAATLWIVLLAVHGLLAATLPASLRPDLFVAFAAFVALAHAIRFITPGHPVGKGMVGFSPVALAWVATAYLADSGRTGAMQPTMFIGGVLILAATWVVMRRAVMRSSGMYKVHPSAVRVSG